MRLGSDSREQLAETGEEDEEAEAVEEAEEGPTEEEYSPQAHAGHDPPSSTLGLALRRLSNSSCIPVIPFSGTT